MAQENYYSILKQKLKLFINPNVLFLKQKN